MCVLSSVNNVKILGVAHFNGKFISLATIKHTLFYNANSPIFWQTVTKCGTPSKILQVPNIKFYKNLSSVSHTVPRKQADGWTTVTGTLHNYASALKQQAPIFTIRCNFSWSILCHKMAWQSWEVVWSWVLVLEKLTGVSTFNIYLKWNEQKQYI
jgi:hypothetical protein